MTNEEIVTLCVDLMRYVIGPVLRVWIAGKVNASSKRNRTASKKSSR
jgi:hypothetical protein